MYMDASAVQSYELYMVLMGYSHVTGPVIYNENNTFVRCELANSMLSGAIHKINRDGTGSVDYTNDFSTDNYLSDAYDYDGVTYDATDEWLELADDSYIYWKVDTKYPIAGIPTLTSQIEVIEGIPTIQISLDGSNWYDIDEGINNNVLTEYNLFNEYVKFKGRTLIYFRIDCTGIGTNTCIIKNVSIHADMVTTHALMPEIVVGEDNTFVLSQDTGSALNCTVTLDWRDRKLM
jgi:hypothetical protein